KERIFSQCGGNDVVFLLLVRHYIPPLRASLLIYLVSPLRKSQNGTLNLSLLWYGQFTPVQKERAHGLGICNKTYALTINGSIKGQRKQQPYVVVSNPELQCPGEC
ncbi:unnamed protein product, partial [Brassica rapa subsp. narinosa]